MIKHHDDKMASDAAVSIVDLIETEDMGFYISDGRVMLCKETQEGWKNALVAQLRLWASDQRSDEMDETGALGSRLFVEPSDWRRLGCAPNMEREAGVNLIKAIFDTRFRQPYQSWSVMLRGKTHQAALRAVAYELLEKPRHYPLAASDHRKIRAVYAMLGRYLGESFERFQDGFMSEECPMREIEVWATVVLVFVEFFRGREPGKEEGRSIIDALLAMAVSGPDAADLSDVPELDWLRECFKRFSPIAKL